MSAHLDIPFSPFALHFFCGSGGMAKGFQDAGFRGAGLDYDPRACDDYRRLTGEPAHCVNIATLTVAELLALFPECPDVAGTSSPCVGLSGCLSEELSKTEKYQAFNALTLRGVELMVETWKHSPTSKRKQPGLIVFENVPRITSRGRVFLDRIVALLQREGYSVHMSSHCCGELAEGLAEKRPRFLLVARHMATVPDYLRRPRKNKPLALREVLCEFPPPRPDTKGSHRLPDLSDLNKLRLALIPAGGDWRDLPPEVLLYHCESHELEAVTGIRWKETAGRMTGKLGVLSWEAPGVSDHKKKRQNGGYGVNAHDKPSGTIVAEGSVQNTRAAIVDPQLACRPRATAYGVAADDQPLGTVVGAHAHDNSVGSTVDPRLGHAPRRDSYGVQSSAEPSSVVRGEHSARQAPGAVDDPRVGKRTRKAKPAKDHGIQYDERGWPIATHELVKLADGRFVLYGPPRDFTKKRPVAGMVIRSYDGTLHRALTTAELKRIQGFPNWFEFCGPASCGDDLPDGTPQTGQRKRIGNAVPPPAAYAIGRECYETLLASAQGGLRLSGAVIWVEREERLSA